MVLKDTVFVATSLTVFEICLLKKKKMTSLSNNDSEVQEKKKKTIHKGSDKSNPSFVHVLQIHFC